LPGAGGLTAPYTRSNRPLWLAGFPVVSAVVGACVLRLLVEFVPRTSSTIVATTTITQVPTASASQTTLSRLSSALRRRTRRRPPSALKTC
jgi:hypothetical protein